MNRNEIETEIFRYLTLSVQHNVNVEDNKLEFKSRWYNLKSDELYSFLKHLTAIANSPGGGSGFLVFGFDESNRAFTSSCIQDSGFSDTNEVVGFVNKRIDKEVDFEIIDTIFEDNKISIVHIRPSITKPHVLPFYKHKGREYSHEIFVRKGTSSIKANRDALEIMYSERDNISVDYKLVATCDLNSSSFGSMVRTSHVIQDRYALKVYLYFSFINLGRRPVAIKQISADFEFDSYLIDHQNLKLKKAEIISNGYVEFQRDSVPARSIRIQPNEVVDAGKLNFSSDTLAITNDDSDLITNFYLQTSAKMTVSNVRFKDIFGKTVYASTEVI